MTDKNPLDYLLAQIGKMLVLIKDHKGPLTNLSPEVFLELEKLEKAVDLFEEINEKAYKEAQINIEKLKTDAYSKHSKLASKDRMIMDRAKRIEQDARDLQLQCSLIINRAKLQSKVSNPDSAKQDIKNRKKKFKPLGGNKGWIPL